MFDKIAKLISKLLRRIFRPPPPLIPYKSNNLDFFLLKNHGDSCYDIQYSGENYLLKSGEFRLFETGLFIELPENYEVQIRSRSGLSAKNGIFVLNSPGTGDEGYRGEYKVILANFGKEAFLVEKGMRIAQIAFHKCNPVELRRVEEISQYTKRGTNGFGSSGLY